MRARAPAIVWVCGFLLTSRAAWAGEHAHLDLARGPGAQTCPDEKALSDAVAARLGYEPFVADAPLVIAVRFSHAADGWRGTVEMRGASGEEKGARTLQSTADDCQEVAEAAGLTISILLDPRAGLGPKVVKPPPPPTPAEVPDLAHARDPTSLSPPPKELPARRPLVDAFEASAHFAGSIGLLPGATWGFVGGVTAVRAPWSLSLEGRFDAPASGSGAHPVTASFAGAELVPCARWNVLRGCLVFLAGALDAHVAAATPEGTTAGLMTLFGPRVGARAKLTSWLALDAQADLLYAPTSVSIRAGGDDTLWTTPALSGLIAFGLVGTIP